MDSAHCESPAAPIRAATLTPTSGSDDFYSTLLSNIHHLRRSPMASPSSNHGPITAKVLATQYAQEKCKTLLASTNALEEEELQAGSVRLKKDRSEMDEEELLLVSEEGKKLTSKERRQLRNRVSARQFRLRRKEYINHLEGLVHETTNEIDILKKTIEQLRDQNKSLADDLQTVRQADSSISQCRMCGNCSSCRPHHEEQKRVLAKSYQEVPSPPPFKPRPKFAGAESSSPESRPIQPVLHHQPQQQQQQQQQVSPISSRAPGTAPGRHPLQQPSLANSHLPQSMQPSSSAPMWHTTSTQAPTGSVHISPNVASLLPNYPWTTAATQQHQQQQPQSGSGAEHPSSHLHHPHPQLPPPHIPQQEWPLDYSHQHALHPPHHQLHHPQHQHPQQPQHPAHHEDSYMRLPHAQIYNSFVPEIEKMLDEQFSKDETEIKTKDARDPDEVRLKLSLAAAEDLFKRLDSQLAGLTLNQD